MRTAITETSYVTLVELGEEAGEQRFWLLAIQDGLPVKRMDLVGDTSEVMAAFKDHLNTLDHGTVLPIYTDQAAMLTALPYELDVRPFSLGILGHSIQKRDFNRAAFRRHTSLPIIPILICVGLVAAGCIYYVHQVQAEEAARRDAALIRERAIAQRKQELFTAVSTALNSTLPARIAVPAYLEATQNLKRSMAGWKLTTIECSGPSCTLTYKAQAFATWAGYLKAKPTEWPTPSFDSDIEKVTQPIPAPLPDQLLRSAESLPKRDQVRLQLGNLAQISKNLGMSLTLPSAWNRVAGNSALNSPEEQWVPVAGDFVATGSAVLLKDLARRLPETGDVFSLIFKLDDPLTFDLKGKAYANP